MGKSQKLLYGSLAAVAVVALLAVWSLRGGSEKVPGKYDDFAKCLSEKGAIMYGAYWCPHCQNQEEIFGNSWKFVSYVECSLPNRAGQTELCRKAGVDGYPTWEFSGGGRAEGELSLQQLSEKSGCGLGE